MYNYIYLYGYKGIRRNRKKFMVAKYKNMVYQYNRTENNTNNIPVQKKNDLSTARKIFLNSKDV